MSSQRSAPQQAVFMFALMLTAESIFALPFLIARVFRPTLLDVFQITNFELGTAFSMYGTVALLSYLPGGPLADRFSARSLVTVALLVTAVGGLYYATVPGLAALKLLYAFWGLSTVLLYWAALIRATRLWGGQDSQGRAFGILDGGRGLIAAMLATVTVAIFAALLPEDVATASLEQRAEALKQIILIFTGVTVSAAVLAWVAIPSESHNNDKENGNDNSITLSWPAVLTVLKNPAVWLQGMIVVTAYVGFKGMDDLSLLARDVLGFDDVEAAQVGTVSFWVRPVAALAAGLIGDKFGGIRTIAVCFATLIGLDLAVAAGVLVPTAPWLLFAMVVAISAAVFGLRGLYFAIFDQAGVPAALTGTAVGMVSLVGYTPDIFMGPLNGYLTDTYPGALGHQYFFAVLAAFAALGLICTVLFARVTRSPSDVMETAS